eukprot:874079-Ditylum_brightwellii.AAC.1
MRHLSTQLKSEREILLFKSDWIWEKAKDGDNIQRKIQQLMMDQSDLSEEKALLRKEEMID